MAQADVRSIPSWTVLSLLEWGSGYLASKGFDEPRLTVDLLLARVLGLPRLNLYLQFDRPLVPGELQRFKELFRRRLQHEPLQYILGDTEFMGLRIAVDRTVLIPRPETELLAEAAISAVRSLHREGATVLDVGTGSGNIALAVAHHAPGTRVTAIDISAHALATARRNAAALGLDTVAFEQVDIFSDALDGRTFDIVVSNPPYIPAAEFESLQPEVRDFEPRIATTDDADGFRVLRRIASVSRTLLPRDGSLLVEIGFGQADTMEQILLDSGYGAITTLVDFSGIPRVVIARMSADRAGEGGG